MLILSAGDWGYKVTSPDITRTSFVQGSIERKQNRGGGPIRPDNHWNIKEILLTLCSSSRKDPQNMISVR